MNSCPQSFQKATHHGLDQENENKDHQIFSETQFEMEFNDGTRNASDASQLT